jgi:hypothetical protein
MTFAAQIAPEIDRLVLAVNQGTGARIRAVAGEMAQDLGLERPGVLKHFAEFLLEATLDEAIAVTRLPYTPPTQTVAEIDAWRRLGLVDGPPEAMVANESLAPLLREMLATKRDVAGFLWGSHPGVVDEASEIAARVVDGISDEYAVAIAHRAVPIPDDRYDRLHRRLTTIRYARAWAHASAWRSQGFDIEGIKTLTALWHGEGAASPQAAAKLAEDGLVTEEPSGLTVAGTAMREAIERQTNANVEPVFTVIDGPERSRLLEALAVLPGESR